MNKLKTILSLIIALSLCGCSVLKSKPVVVIGSANNDQNTFVAEIMAKLLEDKGYKVTRKYNLNESELYDDLVNKKIDLYPSYLNVLYQDVLGHKDFSIGKKKYNLVKEELSKKNVICLQRFAASKSFGIAIRTELSKEYNIMKISQLKKYSTKFRFASNTHYFNDEFGEKLFNKHYGQLKWKSVKTINEKQEEDILDYNLSDVMACDVSNGGLEKNGKVLKDDKKIFRDYNNIVPLTRKDVIVNISDLKDIYSHLAKVMSTRQLREYTARFSDENQDYDAVSNRFINEEL